MFLAGVRVLVVDDDPMLRDMVRTVIQFRGGDVVGEASDGLEAEALAFELDPDVIVMDLDMPRMGGLEACRRISERNRSVRIIIFSGLPGMGQSAAPGSVACVRKGTPVGELVAAIAGAGH